MGATTTLLKAIPSSEVIALDSGCCGMAGLFGYEHYDLSQAIGERRLLPAVRQAGSDAKVVATGFSCRQQIAHFTGSAATGSYPTLLTHTDSRRGLLFVGDHAHLR